MLKIVSTPLIKGGLRGDQRPPYQGGIKGGIKGGSAPPLSRGDQGAIYLQFN
ncbi:hypothetical protein C789_702 [Microcystis aeruginosa FACHB-905 = DIANCHI905]|uniref:Uncharacterized protein n=1 Tax=Microcystis aeruginosa PCC 7806SL TaxID=1903187 RepID=A0AB33BNF4_MICA7|nr:hypothetical protein BH695_1402 [Microcystis aeruginosa PCC 7806SL]ELS49490.1 hypothetical protein C789_702 [Microcystis aeruginosa FACHB-905 = DIANCHI905]